MKEHIDKIEKALIELSDFVEVDLRETHVSQTSIIDKLTDIHSRIHEAWEAMWEEANAK